MTRLLATTALAVAIASPAFAWDAKTTGRYSPIAQDGGVVNQPIARAGAFAGARAGASASTGAVTVNNTYAGAASGNPASGAADPNVGNHGWNGQLPVATAYAPSFGTVNPCVGTSASLGAQFQLFGLSAGGQQMDEECRILRLGSPADVEAARNLICIESSDARTAYYEAGLPCPADRAKYQQALAEQQPAPVPAPVRSVSVFPDGDHSAEACPVGLYGAALRARPWCNQDDEP